MAITFRAAAAGNSSTSAVTSIATTLPTGWQAGDLVVLGVMVITTTDITSSWSQSAGSTFTQWKTESIVTSQGPQAATYYRVMQAGDTAPTIGWGATSARAEWVTAAFTPDANNTLSIDSTSAHWNNSGFNAGTSDSPFSVTAVSGEVGVIVNACAAAAKGSTAITFTDSSGWTLNTNAHTAQAGNASNASGYCDIIYKTGLSSGTLAPGSESFGVSACLAVFVFLIQETASSSFMPVLPYLVSQAVNAGAYY